MGEAFAGLGINAFMPIIANAVLFHCALNIVTIGNFQKINMLQIILLMRERGGGN